MGELLGIYVFGSVARGDRDARSDLDLLAVVADGGGKVNEQDIYAHVPSEFAGLEPSISWYGRRRLGKMFGNGELFAWHLHQEAIPLYEVEPVFKRLGAPSPYSGAAADVASFQAILAGIPSQLHASPENAVYELGLLYVCLRNICMAASARLCDRPDFSRYSPFRLSGISNVPMTPAEYDLAMACRMAGQRGIQPPGFINGRLVAEVYDRLGPWIGELLTALRKD